MSNKPFDKEDRRALGFILVAIGIVIAVFVVARLLLEFSELDWASLILAALPSILLTAYTPALRDLKKWWRPATLALLTVVVGLGHFVITDLVVDEKLLWPTVIVGWAGLVVTAVIALVDWGRGA